MRKILIRWVVFNISILISSIVVTYFRLRDSNRIWDSIAPYGEDAFWEIIPQSVIDTVMLGREGLPTRITPQDAANQVIFVFLVSVAVSLVALLFYGWIKPKKFKKAENQVK